MEGFKEECIFSHEVGEGLLFLIKKMYFNSEFFLFIHLKTNSHEIAIPSTVKI